MPIPQFDLTAQSSNTPLLLANLGNTFTNAFEQGQKRALQGERQRALTELGQTFGSGGEPNFRAAAAKLMSLGDLEGATGFLKLGEAAQQRLDEKSGREAYNNLFSGGGGGSPQGQGRNPAPFRTSDPVASGLQPIEAGLLNGIAGGESAGKYNIRYTPQGGRTFELNGQHPGIREAGPHGPSTAAGRYQFTQTTWNSLPPEAKGDGSFSPENQDRAALFLARRDYQQRTGRDLYADLQSEGMSPRVQSALAPTWLALKGNQDRWQATFADTVQRLSGGQPRQVAAAPMPPQRPAGVGGPQFAETEADVQRLEAQMASQQGAPQPTRGVQIANNEADVRRLEAQMAGQQGVPQGGPVQQLLADADYYEQNGNIEAARQFRQRAAAMQGGQAAPVQMAQASGPMADVPAQGGQPAQFAVPGQAAPISDIPPGDPLRDRSTSELRGVLAANPRLPEPLRRELTDIIQNRQKWAAEGETRMIQRENLRIQQEQARLNLEKSRNENDPDVMARRESAKLTAQEKAREAAATRQGLQGEDRKFFILNGRVPNASEKLTNDQANAGLYADRMRAANAIISKPAIGSAAMGFSGSAQRLATDLLPGSIANNLVTSNFQQLDQAQRDFINAVLRRESGATIQPHEFENAQRQYFPLSGDAEPVLKQKAANRQIAIDGISRAGGPAYAKDNPPGTTAGNRVKPTDELMKGAKRGDDGKMYVPDPNRPGKYLRFDP
jgi:muramidase (phage lysozyme)